LKPNNIFFDFDWSIKVGDFGLSKRIAAGESSPTTSSEEEKGVPQIHQTSYIGTKPYMAPEQESSNTYNHKVDVYALAIILFELLMGPFKTDSERIDLISKLKSFQLPPKLQDANIVKINLFKNEIKFTFTI
jgi:serine/threonine protein kinase